MFQILNISVAINLFLASILIFIWVFQRSEKYALYFGLGELGNSLLGFSWGYATDWGEWYVVVLVLCLCLFSAGFAAGSRFFIGKHDSLNAMHWLGFTLVGICLIGLGQLDIKLFIYAILVARALVFSACGYALIRQQRHYKIAGWIFLLRAGSNIGLIFALISFQYLQWVTFFATTIQAVSTLSLIYAAFYEAHHRFISATGLLTDGFMLVDDKQCIQQINPALLKVLGNAKNSLLGKSLGEAFPAAARGIVRVLLARLHDPNETFPIIETVNFPHADKDFIYAELSVTPFPVHGRMHAMVQVRDISERRQHEKMLEHMANYDEVSGLLNRHALNDRLSKIIAACAKNGNSCAILFIDLDHFKRINDTLGHSMGDALLQEAAARLRDLTDRQGFVARFGGDEFVIVLHDLLENTAPEAAKGLSRQILMAFSEPFSLGRSSIVVTPSIGVAHYPDDGTDLNTLLQHADLAMYAAKNAGRNEVRCFDEAMNQTAQSTMQIGEELRQAVARGELFLVYQPIVDAHTRKLQKLEALVRWRNPSLGFVPPDQFIPVAEENGLIVEIGEWILREACRQAGEWRESALAEVVISVNVSAWQLVDTHFVDLVQECLTESGIYSACLELELTERVLIDEENNVRESLIALQQMGVKISLDDFGTGYSSLNYLTRFRLDTLKIDRSFILDIEHSQRSQNLAQAIIAMGRSLEIQLVAEGVETAEQALILRDMGCDYLQGYHFSKPLPANELQQFIVSQ